MKQSFSPQILRSKKYLIAIPLLFFIVSHSFAQVLDVTFDLSSYAGGYHVACNGSTNGSIVATIVNGTSPYTYVWNTGATTQNLTNVGAGVYTLTVTDNASHTKTKTVTLLQSAVMQITLGASNYNGYNVSRYGGTDGTVASNVTGGAPSYTYLWSNGATVSGLSNVAAGTYTVTVTDANGCTKQKSITLTQPTAMAVSSITSTLHNTYNVSCNGGSDGVINLTASGGVPPYNYQWNNGSFSQNQTNLSAGTYTVVVRDVNNASVSGSITLTQPTAIAITATPYIFPDGYNVSCFQCFNGSITTTVTGGKSPYTYLWSGSQTTSTLSSLGGGTYTLTVTDLNSCTKQNTTTLTEHASNDWSMSGNNAINANTTFIGTLDTSSIALRTNNTERLRIKSDGKIGIGTKTPQAKLQVAGTVIIDSLKFTSSTANEMRVVGTRSDGKLQLSGLIMPLYPNQVACMVPVIGFSQITDCAGTPLSDDIFKYPTTGNVGIGITAPIAKLDLHSDGNDNTTTALSVINVNQVSLFTIKDDGSIGIGDVSPSEKLTVNGIIYAKQSIIGKRTTTGSLAIAANTGSTDGGTVELYSAADNKEVRVIGNAIRFYDYDAANASWNQNMNINSDGKVGIGTEYPTAKLHIVTAGNSATVAAFQINNSSQTNLITVKENGQVGINWDFSDAAHAVTDYKLAVNGKIISTGSRVQLQTAWPDYVFDITHVLMSLTELEAYVYENKHLPLLPPANEVAKEGIDLGEMNRLLVEKVEELTLYIIDLQKQIDQLKIH